MEHICGHHEQKKMVMEMINTKWTHLFLYGPSGIGRTLFREAVLDVFRSKIPVEINKIDSAKSIHSQLLNFSLKYFQGLKIAIFDQIVPTEQDMRTMILFCNQPTKLLFIFNLDNEYSIPYQLVRKTLLCKFTPPQLDECITFFENFPEKFYTRTKNISSSLRYRNFYGNDETTDKVDCSIDNFIENKSKGNLFSLLDEGHNANDLLYRIYIKIYENANQRKNAITLLEAISLMKRKHPEMIARVALNRLE